MLLVKPTGARTWVQRVMVHNKRRDIGLGGYPLVSLAQARELALENKRDIAQGKDPIREKVAAKTAALKRITFAEAARRTCDELTPTWKGKKEAQSFINSLTTYSFPHFGGKYVEDVTSADVRRAVLQCRAKVPNLAVKVQHRILSVFKYAVASGLRGDNPATSDALALPKFERNTKNNRSLPYGQIAKALVMVDESGAFQSTKLAIKFVAYTAGRSGEVRGAVWDEIDMANAVWTIPAGRMKMNRVHKVPLSAAAIDVLEQSRVLGDGAGLVFPSAHKNELSDNTLSKLLRELAIPSTIHGFRASFRTWCQEKTNVSHEVAEAALAHVTGDKTVAAYARSDLFDKRRDLMAAWASYLKPSQSEKIVKLRLQRDLN
jgi:integrase